MAFFAFDSRENHLKHAETGSYSLSIAAFTFGQTDTLTTHSLGYFPNVRVYHDYSGDVWPVSENFWSTLKPDVRSSVYNTSTQLIMRSDNIEASEQTPDVLFRVYKDGDTTNDVAFSTKETSERLLGVFTGSFTASGSSAWTEHSFAHGLGEKCFPVLRWRESGGEWSDQDLINWNAGRTANTNALPHCDSTNGYVAAFNSHAGDKTIEYEVYLYKLEDNDSVLFDSRERTFTNFDEGETRITLSGVVNSGQTVSFSSSITHSEGETLGLLYLNKSDDSTKDWLVPLAPLEMKITTGGADLDANIQTEHKDGQLDITVFVNNPTGGSETITSVDWDFRYALFVA